LTVYLDTSNLVKLYIDEPDSDEIRQLVELADVITTSVVAYPETRATFARRRRERLMTPAESKAAVRQLDADWRRLVTIPLSEELARDAGRLADAHGVRGFDAVHLAARIGRWTSSSTATITTMRRNGAMKGTTSLPAPADP
jgi:predicted nucleic acid-binding protein